MNTPFLPPMNPIYSRRVKRIPPIRTYGRKLKQRGGGWLVSKPRNMFIRKQTGRGLSLSRRRKGVKKRKGRRARR